MGSQANPLKAHKLDQLGPIWALPELIFLDPDVRASSCVLCDSKKKMLCFMLHFELIFILSMDFELSKTHGLRLGNF